MCVSESSFWEVDGDRQKGGGNGGKWGNRQEEIHFGDFLEKKREDWGGFIICNVNCWTVFQILVSGVPMQY